MAINIENPTAEEIYEALKQVPQIEVERLRVMLGARDAEQTEEAAWHQASQTSAARFFGEEENRG